MAGILDTINAILRRSGIDPNAGSRPAAAPEDFTSTQQQPGQLEAPAPAAPEAVAAGGDTGSAGSGAPAERPALTLPFRGDTQDSLERMQNTRAQFEYDLQELFRIRGVAGTARAAATTSGARQRATDEYNEADNAVRQMQAAIAAQDSRITGEENRRRDEKKAEDAKDPKPKNGDTRIGRDTYTLPNGQTVRGVFTEVYNNGTWSFVPGSSKREEGWAGQPQGAGTPAQVITDGRGSYWTFDPVTKKVDPLVGPQAGAKTVTGPDGAVYLQKPDGSVGERLFEGLPQVYTSPEGFMIGVDKRTGAETFRIDTKTKEGRELATRLERATVEAAERAADPKFSSAIAQFQQEATRRQGLAREELARLQELQKLGQLSPEQAEAQFDRWMKLNVEGPLAGFKEAAEQERRRQEQENLTRQRAEEARVENLNRERERLAFEAGEEGRRTGIELGKRTRAPEFIADMGALANSFSANVGKPGAGASGAAPFQFSPASFAVENYRKAVPNLNELADAAVNRLFSRISPATARDVNVPLPGLPTGPDLQGLMNGVRYTPPSPGTPASPGREVAEGQGAVDLKDQGRPGWARTVYRNGEYEDWQIPQAAGAVAQAAAPTPEAPTLPGQLPGETPEQRAARWAAIMAR